MLAGFKWPGNDTYVISCFGWRDLCTNCASYYNCHQGIDIAASEGDPVYSIYSGTVTAADWVNACGNHLTIEHQINGHKFYTNYCHLSAFAPGIGVGTVVTAGQKVALAGSTEADGPHIHITISESPSLVNDNDRINPACIFGKDLNSEDICSRAVGNNGVCNFNFDCPSWLSGTTPITGNVKPLSTSKQTALKRYKQHSGTFY